MLADKAAVATIPVKNLTAARAFYGKLGFRETASGETGVATYRSGNTTMLIYESEYAGTHWCPNVWV